MIAVVTVPRTLAEVVVSRLAAYAVHAYPLVGRKHEFKKACWCRPRIEDYRQSQGDVLFIHRCPN